MKKSRYSDHPILAILKQAEVGTPVPVKEVAQYAVQPRSVSIRLACTAAGIRETGYRYPPKWKLNLRIKPKKRLIREAPNQLEEPKTINDTGSMRSQRQSRIAA